MDRGLQASFRCSNHGSTIKKRMHQLNWCRSWSFVYGFERFWFLCFRFKSLSKRVCLWIRWFTTIDIRCNPWNLYSFLEIFRVFM